MPRSQARTIIDRASAEARQAGSPTIEAEHVLLAISAQQGTSAQRVLASVGLDRPAIHAALDQELEHSLAAAGVVVRAADLPHPSTRPGRHPRIGTSVKLAMHRAMNRAVKGRRLDPTLILLGVLGAKVGTVPRALALAGVDQAALTERVRQSLSH
jgi:D-alanyl-D-alanine carboxypeptidase